MNRIKKTAIVKEYELAYLCECGHKPIQNDNFCGGCGRKIDSEEWDVAMRMKMEVEFRT